MVAVALSPEVRPVPVPSVEEHISQLKAAAKKSAVRSEAEKQPNGDAGNTQGAEQSTASNGNNAYLPPPEVARQIPCRYYPNCSYAEKCIFLHPQPSSQLPPTAEESYLASPTSNGSQGNIYYDPNVLAQMGQPVYYYPASVNGTGSSSNGQSQIAGNDYGAMQMQQAEYMQYSQAAAYAAQQQQYYGYAPQHMQAYGNGQYPQYAIPYVTQSQQAMYASYPQAAYAPQQQPTSPVNGQAADASVVADPAIISQAARQSPSIQQGASTVNGVSSPASATALPPASQENSAASTTNGQTASGEPSQAQSPSSNAPVLSPSIGSQQASFANYVSVPMALPTELQQATYNYASHPEAVRAQAQLEADFAKAAINGQSRTSPASSSYQQLNGVSQPSNKNDAASATSPRHERSSSMQMHTFFQTGGESTAEASAASSQDASAHASTVPTAINGNAFSASISARPPNGSYNPRADNFASRNRADAPANGAHVSGHAKRASFGGFANPRAPGNGPRGPWPRPFDSSRPVSNCVFFSKSECRYGDACHNVHLLREEVPIPGQDGKTTRDAKVLRMNIGGPDGSIAAPQPFHPRQSKFNGEGPRGGFNGPRFPNGFPAQQQQASAITEKRNNVVVKDESDVKEKFEKLISETPRLNGSHAEQRISPNLNAHPTNPLSPPSGAQNQSIPARQQIQQQIAQNANTRPNSISPNGRKANNVTLNARQNFGQRIPSGEKDFPALSTPSNGSAEAGNNATPNSTSITSQTGPAQQTAAAAAQPSQSASAQTQVASNATQSTQQQQTSAQPATKPAFSWASAAAKAASLPDPPKRAISKPRAAAPAAKAVEADAPPAAAAQALTSESTAAPAVTA